MADKNKAHFHDDSDFSSALPVKGSKPQPGSQVPRLLPPWKVLLHNDSVNEMSRVVEVIRQLTPLNREEAIARMNEAHTSGSSVLLITHQERAELYAEQFQSCRLTVTIEPAG